MLPRQEYHQLLDKISAGPKQSLQVVSLKLVEARQRGLPVDGLETEAKSHQKVLAKVTELRKLDLGTQPEESLSFETLSAVLFSLNKTREEFAINGNLNREVENIFSPLRARVKETTTNNIKPFLHQMGKVLTSIVLKAPSPKKGQFTVFSLVQVPGLSIEDLLLNLTSKLIIDPFESIPILIKSVILYTRYCTNVGLKLGPSIYEFHRLFIIAFHAMCKFDLDFAYNNGTCAELYGIAKKDFNALEVTFLTGINFDFKITPELFNNHKLWFEKYNISEETHLGNLARLAQFPQLEVEVPLMTDPSPAVVALPSSNGSHKRKAAMFAQEQIPVSSAPCSSSASTEEGMEMILEAKIADQDYLGSAKGAGLNSTTIPSLITAQTLFAQTLRQTAILASASPQKQSVDKAKISLMASEAAEKAKIREEGDEAPLKRQCIRVPG